jgi:hypothetical protein
LRHQVDRFRISAPEVIDPHAGINQQVQSSRHQCPGSWRQQGMSGMPGCCLPRAGQRLGGLHTNEGTDGLAKEVGLVHAWVGHFQCLLLQSVFNSDGGTHGEFSRGALTNEPMPCSFDCLPDLRTKSVSDSFRRGTAFGISLADPKGRGELVESQCQDAGGELGIHRQHFAPHSKTMFEVHLSRSIRFVDEHVKG